jgi:TRAP-type C4-dicarboxylate transport system permease small subunit
VTPESDQPRVTGPLALVQKLLAGVGSLALLVAMSADAVAVAGRHLTMPLLGSIEIVQACVVLAASAATIGTTLAGRHMVVTLVTERLSIGRAARLRRLADATSAVFFAALAAGSVWIAIELWDGHEISETLGIPIRWLRLVWCLSAIATTLLFLRDALRTRREAP